MVDRKLLVEDWQQIEGELVGMDTAKFATARSEEAWWESSTPRLIKGAYRALWHILEYLLRRDKA
jgi:hypothetical protein